MSDRKRLRREQPGRTNPIRNFANLYRQPDFPSSGEFREDQDHASTGAEIGGGKDPLSRSVEIAYQVIDRYIAGGRRAAEQVNSQPYNPRVGGDGLQDILQRMIRYQNELIPLWIDLIGNFVKVDSRNGAPDQRDGASTTRFAHEQPSTVSIELVSGRPVQVSFEHRGNAMVADLATAGLHALQADHPPLTDIKLRTNESGLWDKVWINVPDDHPPGTYSGVIVERRTGEVRGVLSIVIPT